jgi:hypothetical protein
MKNKTLNKDYQTYIVLTLFFSHQFYYVLKGGTTWDDLEIQKTTIRILDKAFWFFEDRTNPFLGDFNFNLEYYGYFVPVIVYIISNFLISNVYTSYLFENTLNIEIYSSQDLLSISRNIAINIYVLFSLIIIYFLISKFLSKNYAFYFLIFLILIPSFNGHALFNIKDIPFLIQYLIAVVLTINFDLPTSKLDGKSLRYLIFLGLIYGLVVLVRFNGYAFLFLLSFFKFINNYKNSINNISTLLINSLIIYSVSFISLILFSPSAWNNPIVWLRGVYNTQFNLDWTGGTLTNGIYVYATEMSPFYLTTWFSYKLPIVYIFTFFVSVFIYLLYKNKYFSELGKFSLYIISIVNLIFFILRPISYDGIRQYLFLLPFFVILFVETSNFINKKFGINIFYSFLIFSIIYLIYSQNSLGPYKYVYFNEFVDENEITTDCEKIGGCGNWETDYWGYSIKELMTGLNSIENIIYCEPIHVFSTYKEPSSINKDMENYYIGSIHRRMDNSLCPNFVYENKNCTVYKKTTVHLRNNPINLSYLYKCEK